MSRWNRNRIDDCFRDCKAGYRDCKKSREHESVCRTKRAQCDCGCRIDG